MNTENLDPSPFIQASFGLVGLAILGLCVWLFWDRKRMARILAVMNEDTNQKD